MVGVLLISHGGMSEGMISTVSMLYPELDQVESLSLWPDDNPDDFQEKLTEKAAEVDTGDGVIILADLLGGTPCNRAMYLLGEKVRLLVGLNLPMLINILVERSGETDLDALVEAGLSASAEGILNVGELMNG